MVEKVVESPVQTATIEFFGPITVAYLTVCLTWLVVKWLAAERWPEEAPPETEFAWTDFGLMVVAVVGVFLVGQLYRNDMLLKSPNSFLENPTSALNLCLPYTPIFLVLLFRRQSTETVWFTFQHLKWKILAGGLASLLGVFVFLGLRNELGNAFAIGPRLLEPRAWVHFPAVFLEALAIAFVFVRLRWVSSTAVAMGIPCLLFAIGHVPSGIENGRSLWELTAFFLFNIGLSASILLVVVKSRDVVWISIPHFLLDIAIKAF